METGDKITEYPSRYDHLEKMEIKDNLSKLKITIKEGKNRQIRKMFESINKNVIFLRRIQEGEIRLGGLSRGGYAELTPKEIRYLHSLKKD